MANNTDKVTKLHLQAFGLSDYTIRQLVKDLEAVSASSGFKEYVVTDLKDVVERRLENSRITPENRGKLQKTLFWLNGESNVVPVDFLKGLSPEKKVEVLRGRMRDLEVQEQKLSEETETLIRQANRMVVGH